MLSGCGCSCLETSAWQINPDDLYSAEDSCLNKRGKAKAYCRATVTVERVVPFKQTLLQNCPVYQVKPEGVTCCLPSESHAKSVLSVWVFGGCKTSPTGSLHCTLCFLRCHAMDPGNKVTHKTADAQEYSL